MFCSVCKINLNSSLQADAHYAGKSHKYKAKSQGSEVSASCASSACGISCREYKTANEVTQSFF